jgi:streptomycin 6-kinase
MPRRRMDQARDLAIQLRGSPIRNLLVNYDLHYVDVLAGRREPWLAVDPMAIAGDPEFGIAQLLWCRLEDILQDCGLERSFKVLIEAAELDPALAHAWTYLRCVDYWLWGVSVGLTYDPARCGVITNWLSLHLKTD